MKNLDSIQIEITRITLNFRPPENSGGPVQKPKTPTPNIDRAFRELGNLFRTDNTLLEDNIFDGTFLTQ